MKHPFAELIGLDLAISNSESKNRGSSECSIAVCEKLLNPQQVVHGAVIYALADTGMGAALYPSLEEGEICATIEIKINYYHAVRSGVMRCDTTVVNRGKSVANMESNVYCDDVLVAKANGHYSIFKPSGNYR